MTTINDVGATVVCALCAVGGLAVFVVPTLFWGRRRRRWYE